jgi:hypothetical protein
VDHVVWMREPRLRNPLMLCAFSGWNDAGDAATLALQTLADQWSAQPFASIDPEVFTDFTQVRKPPGCDLAHRSGAATSVAHVLPSGHFRCRTARC